MLLENATKIKKSFKPHGHKGPKETFAWCELSFTLGENFKSGQKTFTCLCSYYVGTHTVCVADIFYSTWETFVCKKLSSL